MATFKVGDRVRVTEEYAAWYKSNFYDTGFINGATNLIVTAIQSDGGILVTTEDRNVVVRISDAKYLIPNLDTAQAVIEAARAVLAHVQADIMVSRVTFNSHLRVSVNIHDEEHVEIIEEAYGDDFPDTLLGTLAGLRAALDAHDEATIGEDE